MSLQAGATVGAVGFVIGTFAVSQGVKSPFRRRWLFPAALSAGFLAFSLYTVSQEGVLAFWPEHTRNLWGNQIWFDLLLAAGVGYTALAPRARAVGMNLVPWLVTVAVTGSIGLCAMFARVIQLESEKRQE
jgi:hypothetical protein